MSPKHTIIAAMDRDTFKAAVDALELDGVDRRRARDMADRLSRAHRATPEFPLEFLREPQVKQACEVLGVPIAGHRNALVRRLLRRQPKHCLKTRTAGISE